MKERLIISCTDLHDVKTFLGSLIFGAHKLWAIIVSFQKVFGHIEQEEKLKAKLAKKEKALTQIEMDVCVQDMG